jgi:DNA-binding GntR family transcriptional regulator
MIVTDAAPPALDRDGPEPVYVQVATHMAGRIKSGEWVPGRRLPPERELAQFYGVAYDSVRRATAMLREQGLIVTVHGRGTYVAPGAPPPAPAETT